MPSRLSMIISVPEYFIAAVGANVTPTSQLPALTPLDFGPRSSSSQACVMLNGLLTPFSISIRIGSGTFFFLTLPALMTFTSLVLFEPTSTSPKSSRLGETLSLPTTGVGVAVGVAVRVAVGVAVAVAVGVAVVVGVAAD